MKLSAEDVQFLKDNYKRMTDGQIAEKLGKTYDQIRWKRRQLNLKKTPAMVKTMEFVSHKFQKGHVPANAHKDGTIVIRLDNRGIGYKHIKVPGKRRMIMLHVYLWHEAHGKVPKSHAVVFKDGDTMNCTLENLECIHRNELARRNYENGQWIKKVLEQNPELKKLSETTKQLKKSIKDIKKNGKSNR